MWRQQASQPSTRTVGLIGLGSGQYAAFGQKFANGAALAVQDWNAAHPDSQVQIDTQNGDFDASKATLAYQKLVNVDHVQSLIVFDSTSVDAIHDAAQAAGIPVVTFGEQGVPATADNMFQVQPGNVPAEQALGARIKSDGITALSTFVAQNQTYELFDQAFEKGYGSSDTTITIPPDETQVASYVTKALASKPKAVAILAGPQSGALIYKELRSQGFSGTVYFDTTMGANFSAYQQVLGDTNTLNGSVDVELSTSVDPAFTKEYSAKYGGASADSANAVYGYDAVMTTMMAWSTNHATMIQNLQNLSYTAPDGAISFDSVGVRIPKYVFATVKGGQLVAQ